MEARTPKDYPNRYGLASTHWTTIRACVGTDRTAQAARERICRDYWYPIYVYTKGHGHKDFDAEDMVQEFFAYILNKPWFERADRSKGRFRAFLLTSLDNFIRDRIDGRKAHKRGGSYQHIPLDLAEAELRYARTAAARISPAEAYETEWAAALVDAAWKSLEAEYVEAGKQSLFDGLKIFLTVDAETAAYNPVARDLGLSVENVKVCVHRLRKRYGAILREEVARTVEHPGDVAAEMRHIRNAFATKVSAAA